MLLCRLRGVPVWLSASCITALNAMVFGMDTGTIGPVTTMTSFTSTFGHFPPTLHGIIVSSILITGVLAALIVGNLADRYGRTRVIVTGSLIFGLGAALEASSFWLPMFIVGRLIKGAGEGCFLSTVYVLTAELSPKRYRGSVTNLAGVAITGGIVLGYFMCYGTARITLGSGQPEDQASSIQWRLPIAVQSFIALSNSALTALLVPQSPRWLLATGNVDSARQLITKLGLPEDEQAELLAPVTSPSPSPEGVSTAASGTALLEHSPNLSLGASIMATLRDFRVALSSPVRSRTLFGCFIMGMQQFAGIDGLLYYAPLLFAQAGMDSEQARFLASGVSGLLILASTIPSTYLCDYWSRKTAAVSGGLGLSATMILVGGLYTAAYVRGEEILGPVAKWVVIVSIYLYGIIFTATWALVFRMYMLESLPRKSRSSGSALAQASNWLANYVVALTTPVFLSSSTYAAYYFWGFCSLSCTIVCVFVMRETRGRSLEVLEREYEEKHRQLRDGDGSDRSRSREGVLRQDVKKKRGTHGSAVVVVSVAEKDVSV